MEKKEDQAQLDQLVFVVEEDVKENQVRLVTEDQMVLRDDLAHEVQTEKVDSQDLTGHLVHQDPQDHPEVYSTLLPWLAMALSIQDL